MEATFSPDRIEAFVHRSPDAAMITLRRGGQPHVARVEVALVDGHIRSSGSQSLVRARNLRRDPRCSVFVFDDHPWWLGVEGTGTLIEGPQAGPELVRLLRARHPGTPIGMVNAHDAASGADRLVPEVDFIEHATATGLVLIDIEITRAYGNLPG